MSIVVNACSLAGIGLLVMGIASAEVIPKEEILKETFENWKAVALYDSGMDNPKGSLFGDKKLHEVLASQIDRMEIPERIEGLSESRREVVVFYAIPKLVIVDGKTYKFSKDHFAATKDGFEILHSKSKQVVKVSWKQLKAFLARTK